ncbi:hypothetical protein PHJA_002743700 [Phtheirospermum japonicum]|uniref:Uncharacterized protein n=1 Tax=Phtheirospermum japonicum TaxID=374723 RepID=A0A830D2W7_9LAMI|nr:hypothetical protein PHJA_002743700 [Phtheirospermum japonicum]
MSAAALIPATNTAALQLPCFAPARTGRKSSVSVRNSLVIEAAENQASSENPPESVARRLILLRHAKSSRETRSLRDHDRPLSKSGQADAMKLSQKLEQLGWIPELILSSDAQRTRETLKIMQEKVRAFLEAEVHFVSSFYSIAAMDGQTAEHLQQAICKYSSDQILTIMCMGHNRGWEEAASMFSGASVELKTCNAALLEATGKSWEEVSGILFNNLANYEENNVLQLYFLPLVVSACDYQARPPIYVRMLLVHLLSVWEHLSWSISSKSLIDMIPQI